MSGCTTIHEISMAFVISPVDDAMGSNMPLLSKEQAKEKAAEALQAYIEQIVPNGHLCTVLVKTRKAPTEKTK